VSWRLSEFNRHHPHDFFFHFLSITKSISIPLKIISALRFALENHDFFKKYRFSHYLFTTFNFDFQKHDDDKKEKKILKFSFHLLPLEQHTLK